VHLQDLVVRLKAGEPPATSHLADPGLVALARRLYRDASIREALVVLNGIPEGEKEAYVRSRLADQGIEPVGVVRPHPELEDWALRGLPLDWTVARGEVLDIVERLEATAQGARRER
jgi:CO dehydrogenase nickel-insertion accessory protein CooC1